MKHFQLLIASVLAMVFLLSSCKKDDYVLNTSKGEANLQAKQNEGLVVLGKQLEDPYSIKNMKQAYFNLKSVNAETPDLDIQPTHTYMRFLPKNEEEWGILKSDTTLVLYDFPLDYEITNLGTSYHDPSLPADAITWQYCVVPIGHTIPSILNEILYEVYIPSADGNSGLKSSSVMIQFLKDLEYESVKLTGNLPKNKAVLKSTLGLLPAEWTPKGTIKVWDSIIGSTTNYTQVFDHWEYYDCSEGGGPVQAQQTKMVMPPIDQCQRAVYRTVSTTVVGSYIPLIQATVHARWFTHIETDLTDNNGYFETSKFNYEVNYAIKWQRADFEIREGSLGQAWYNGPKQKGDWNLNISSGMSRMYATIHRAAYDYYYNNPFGIQSPPLNKWYNNILAIGAFDWENVDPNGDIGPWRRWIGTAEIRIFKPSRNSRDIYASTIHELAHASHWDIVGGYSFAFTLEDIVAESWSRGVQWEFTRRVYDRYPGGSTILHKYTQVVMDLIDNRTMELAIPNAGLNGDGVEGYTLQQIEQALKGAKTFNQWRDNLKNLYNNDTEQNVDALFAFWN